MKRIVLLLTLGITTISPAWNQNLLDIIGNQIHSNVVEDYEDGVKWVTFFHADAVFGATVFIDMADYMGVTQEGMDGWVTLWLDATCSVGVPIAFGCIPRQFDLNAPDASNYWMQVTGNVSFPGIEVASVEIRIDQFEIPEIALLELNRNLDFEVSAGVTVSFLSLEVRKEDLIDFFNIVTVPGAGIIELANLLVDVASNDVSWAYFLRKSTRLTTLQDDPDVYLTQSVRADNLVVGKWSNVYVDVQVKESDYYKEQVWDFGGILWPEWDWDQTFPVAGPANINAGDLHTFSFRVKPTDSEGEFAYWLYQQENIFGQWRIIEKIKDPIPLYALPYDADVAPPFVCNISSTTSDPNTNFIVLFSEPISPFTVNQKTITVTGSQSGEVICNILVSSSNDMVTLDPSADLNPGENVTITVYPFIQDGSGNWLLNKKTKQFAITEELDRTVSTLTATSNIYSLGINDLAQIQVVVLDQNGSPFADQPITFSHSNTGSFSGSNPAFSSATGVASISYTPSAEGSHIVTATSANGKTASISLSVGGSAWPPSITVNYPNNEIYNDECFIAWSASDPDNNATIYLYYDNNNFGFDGTCINPGNPIFEDATTGYAWNTLSMPEGFYWIYAVIDDGTNQASDYSPGYVEIKHPQLSYDFDYSSMSTDEEDGDGDQILESGESFELMIRIRNESISETYNLVEAILTCSNSNVTITDNDSYYGAFAVGEAKWGDNDFFIQVAPGYTGNIDFALSLEFKDAEGYEYYQILDIPNIYISQDVTPGFEVVGVQIIDDGSKCNNDGILQSGENSIDYKLQIRNNGSGDAIDVICEVQPLPAEFDTQAERENYPDIPAGSALWPAEDDHFYLREIPYDFTGTINAELKIMWADNTFNQVVPFTLTVEPAPRLRYFPETTDFGIQPVGGTAVIPITLTNYGSADIVVMQIEDISANPDNSITGVTFPLTINPSGSAVINFNITRSSPQNVNEAFRIHSNNHIVSTQDILISGTFYNPQPQGYKKLWESPRTIIPIDFDDCKWIEPGDFDNDGLIEAVMYKSNMIHFWEQVSVGSSDFEHKFTYTVPGIEPYVHSLQVGNCDGDSNLDIVFRNIDQGYNPSPSYLRVLEASGNDQYSLVWSTSVSDAHTEHLTVGNCDSDSYDEIIIGIENTELELVVFNRTGDNNYQSTWSSGSIIENYCSYMGLSTTGDTDKDGRNEIILIGEDEYIFIWEYSGSYTLAHSPLVSYTTYPDWGHWAYPSIFDVDGDDKNEIIITSGADDSWKFVVFNPDTWSIDFKNSPGLYGDLTSAAIADLNGNGIPEIFFGEEEAPYRLIVYEYDNGSFFETFKYLPDAGDDIYNIEPFDLTADGSPELLVSNDDYFMVWGYEEVPFLPDLQLAANNFTFSPEEVTDAEEINIYATIHNIGTEAATDIPVEFYLTHPDNGNRIDSLNIPSMAPSGIQPLTINWNSFQTGEFDIYIVIDRLNAIDELTEDNNIQAKTISIIDNDTISPVISSNTHSEFYGDDDGLIEDNEYINISWDVVDESGVNNSYILLNDLQTITAIASGEHSYYAVLTNQTPGLLPYEIHATDNDNSALSSVVRDTILIIKHTPAVTSTLPENGAAEVPLYAEILAFFDLPIDATTINSNTVLLSKSETGIPIAPVSVTWSHELNRLSFIPSKLEYSTDYIIRLVSGPAGITDINGNTLESDYSWTFVTMSEPLDADFMVSDQNPEVGESISFLDVSSGNPISWLWDFGDGSSSTEQNPIYFYSTSGTFTVTLTINDQSGSDFETKEAFITSEQTLQLPDVTTSAMYTVAVYSAQGGGIVTNDGGSSITARGVCWSTSPLPTADLVTKTSDGTGIGEFTSEISGLESGTTYYFRAYATNAVGTDYGEEISFTTYNANAIQDIDGNYYNLVTIGSQTWLGENLRTTRLNDGLTINNLSDNSEWTGTANAAYCFYNNDPRVKNTYGALYNWHAASNENLCPAGWHVPTDAEWTTLTTYLGGESVAGGKLKETGLTHWLSPNTGATDESGFTALPGGLRSPADAQYYYVNQGGYWWSSTERISTDGWARQMFNNTEQVIRDLTGNDKNHGFSVRCIKDHDIPSVSTSDQSSVTINEAQSGGFITNDGGSPVIERGVCWSTDPSPTADLVTKTSDGTGIGEFTSEITGLFPGTTYYMRAYATNAVGTGYGDDVSFTTYNADAIVDIDGNYYNQIAIGTQIWLGENLKTTRLNNGSPITLLINSPEWAGASGAAYCWYDNDNSYKDTYGALYNWNAASDENLCPAGWHVPSDDEWNIMEGYLIDNGFNYDGTITGNKIAKSLASVTLWESSTVTGAVGNTDYPEKRNATHFAALPGGLRGGTGLFQSRGSQGWFWTSLSANTSSGWDRAISTNSIEIMRGATVKSCGFSVRCLRNVAPQQTISLSEGWNLFSLAVEPSDMTMTSVLESLMAADLLLKVQDEEGKAIEDLGDPMAWVNEIGQLSLTEGYKIRVSENRSINVTGQPPSLPMEILLEGGWNIMGYPSLSTQPASSVFDPLISTGALIKVQNEQGAAIEEVEGEWLYGFENLSPGEGYRVKTGFNTLLTVAGGLKGAVLSDKKPTRETVHFLAGYTGNGLDHMNIYIGKPGLTETELSPGDEIGVFDGDLCVGAVTVNEEPERYLCLTASYDDPETTVKDGFDEGSIITFRLWDYETGQEKWLEKVEVIKGKGMVFERMGTVVLKAEFEKKGDLYLGNAWPNPSKDRTIFTFNLPDPGKVRFEILDLKGSPVKVLIDQELPAGSYEIAWDNCTETGSRAIAGFYIYRLVLDQNSLTKQLVIR